MAQSLSKIIVHAVFSTKDRHPFLHAVALRDELNRYIGGILIKLDCQPIIVGSVEDHLHFLCSLSRTCEPAHLVKEVKRGSSIWLKTKGSELEDFTWQSGYGIFSMAFPKSNRLVLILRDRGNIIGRFRFKKNFGCCYSDTKSHSMSDMSGIDPTLAGLEVFFVYPG